MKRRYLLYYALYGIFQGWYYGVALKVVMNA